LTTNSPQRRWINLNLSQVAAIEIGFSTSKGDLREIETWPNHFPNCEIGIFIPEFAPVCQSPLFGRLGPQVLKTRERVPSGKENRFFRGGLQFNLFFAGCGMVLRQCDDEFFLNNDYSSSGACMETNIRIRSPNSAILTDTAFRRREEYVVE
jgi:hypothetical protein